MRFSRWAGATVAAAVLVVGTAGVPAWADSARGMPWRSPARITSGVPFHVASIARCPAVPTPGDTILVQVNLTFGSGGGPGDVLTANPNGSWSGTLTFSFSGVSTRHASISAECLDFNGATGVPYAQYRAHHTRVFD